MERLQLATTVTAGLTALDAARKSDETNWPASHYLGPLHPVLDWASDRALASMSRNEVLAVRGDVEDPTFVMLGTITNRRGQLLNRTFITVSNGFAGGIADLSSFLAEVGLVGKPSNPGPASASESQAELPAAVDAAEEHLRMTGKMLSADAVTRLDTWLERAAKWSAESNVLVQRADVRERQDRVKAEQELAQDMRPEQQLVRPLLVILPRETPTVATTAALEDN